jgi:hypothetical protein
MHRISATQLHLSGWSRREEELVALRIDCIPARDGGVIDAELQRGGRYPVPTVNTSCHIDGAVHPGLVGTDDIPGPLNAARNRGIQRSFLISRAWAGG